MALLGEFRFAGQSGASTNGDVSAVLSDVQPGTGGPVVVAAWDAAVDALALGPSSSIEIPLAGTTAVELAWRPSAQPSEGTLMGGPGCAIRAVAVPQGDGTVGIRASVPLASGPVHVEAAAHVAPGTWTALAVAFTGDELVVALDGAIVARRVIRGATLPALAGSTFVGDDPGDPGSGAIGELAGVRVWDDVPDALGDALAAARAAGLGEIDSRVDELGGTGGWIGAPIGDEQAVAAGRVREYAGATVCWEPTAGTHEVHGAIRDRWRALGGAAGFLGFPVSDEIDADAWFALLKASKIDLAGFLRDRIGEGVLRVGVEGVAAGAGNAGAGNAGAGNAGGGNAGEPAVNLDPRVGVGAAGGLAGSFSHVSGVASAVAAAAAAAPAGASGAAANAGGGQPVGGNGGGDGIRDRALVEAAAGRFGAGVSTIVLGNRMSRFTGGVIAWSSATGAHELHGDIVVKWMLLDGTIGFLGLPLSDEEDSGGGGRRNTFAGGAIYWSPGSAAHEVHGAIRAFYEGRGGPTGFLGFPLTDESDVLDDRARPTGGRLNRFTGGTTYWTPALGVHEVHGAIRDLYEKSGGPLGRLGYPTTDETGVVNSPVRYNDFEHGVIAWTPDRGAQVIDSLTIRLDRADAPSIDDGVEFDPLPSADHSAEMYTFVTVRKDGAAIGGWDNRRTPADGHGGKTIEFDHTEIDLGEIHAGTRIQLDFRARDWDQVSGDDDLGSLSADLGIESWWGTLANGGIHDDIGHGGDGDVHYLYSIGGRSTGDPGPDAMRRDGWWSFSNFKSPRLSRELYTETFLDVEADESWWDTVTNPLDSLFYELAYKGVASKGNCFGMSHEARRALRGISAFREPLSQFTLPVGWNTRSDENNVNAVWRTSLNRAHGAQLGSAALSWFLARLGDLSAVQPPRVYAAVRDLVRGGDRPVISMMNLSDFAGHAVLAYDVADGDPNTIFVCDPNVPFGENGDKRASRIEVHRDGTFQFFNNGAPSDRYRSTTVVAGLLPGTLMIEIPSCVLDQPVRTPIWDIVTDLGFVLGGLILIAGDADTDQITADGAKFYGAAPSIGGSIRDRLSEVLGADAAGQVVEGRTHGFTQLHAALGARRATAAGGGAAASSTAVSPGRSVRSGAGRVSIDDLVRHIDPAVLEPLLYPRIRPNAVPGLTRVPFLDVEDPPELYLQRGPLARDLRVDFSAPADGSMQAFIRSARTAIAIGGGAVAKATGALRLDATRREHPLVELESSQEATSFTVDYVVQQDDRGREGRRIRVELPVGAAGPTRFGPADGLGVVVSPGIPSAPVQLSIETRAGTGSRSVAVSLPGLDATDSVVVRPADLASPLGDQVVDRTSDTDGRLISRTVVTPTTP